MLTSTSINSTKKGTLFIPDISGFTQFVNRTEVSHSKHIIEELLDVIVKEVGDYFEISEIEGDAVLFYRFENQPNINNIKEIAIRMFERFHQHLLYYHRDRVCDCGACSSSGLLTLKFIVHFGPLQEYAIGDRVKLFGREVILAHRLLKNHLDSREYILVTQPQDDDGSSFDFIKGGFDSESESYEDLGKIQFWHKSLSKYKENLAPIPPRNPVVLPKVKLTECVPIHSDIMSIVRAVTEPEQRLNWMKNLNKIELKEHRINRIKTTHECLIGQGNIEVTLEDLVRSEDEVKLVERAKMDFPAMEFFIIYSFRKTDYGTDVQMGNTLEASKNGRLISFSFPLISRLLSHQNFQNLKRLKQYVESETV